jgi:predicted HicB family RNase H-like nuclease
MLKYKGYTGAVELDEESGVLFGRVIGLRDVITFQGSSVAEVVQAFHDSVDDYLEFCSARGESPEKPYSGQFVLRVAPELHRAMAHAAEGQGLSLNALIEGTLKRALGPAVPGGEIAPRTSEAGSIGTRPKRGVAARSTSGTTFLIRKEPKSGKVRGPKGSKGPGSDKSRKR